MKNILPLLLILAPFCLAAQTYSTRLIPDSLRKEARVVVREDEMILEIRSPSKAILKEHHVYTILNENGDNWGGFITNYDKFTEINSVSIVLYDSLGKELKKAKKKDMDDRSYSSEMTLMQDARYKAQNFYYKVYPYTVSYEEEDEINGIRYFHDWDPLKAPGISTQLSKYTIIAPKDYLVRYKPVNCNYQPVITSSGDKKIYTWEVRNLPARTMESEGPKWTELSPHVLLAPSDFEAQGYKGNMSSWESYGKFIYQLLAGRDNLPETTRKKVHELTDQLKDPREKVYALYDYLQKNTHYISIQLGIGGWQPFPADFVATKLYGDCKALSNYMVALLKEAGISGKYVEIWSGDDPPEIIEDFPCSQGNHVISCVPLEKDTIWLECTSQTKSPGYMGSFTGGRKAILIDETGGHIVSTPAYASSDNLKKRIVTARINEEGNLDAEVNTVYTGIQQEDPHDLMREVSAEQREKYLNGLLHLPTYKVEKSSYEEQKGKVPVVKEYLHVLSPNYASVSGKRLFISPNLFDKSGYRLPADSVRKFDFIDDAAFKNVDSIIINIPSGYHAEAIPQDIHIDSKFGKYTASVQVMPDRILYNRVREKSVGRFPPSDYTALVKFYDQVYKADHSRVVLVKN